MSSEAITRNDLTAILNEVLPSVAANKTIIVSKSSVSSLPTTITDSKILADMVCIKAVLSNPAAQTADWTVTTSAGSAVISGTSAISGTTDIKLYLMRS